MIAFRNLLRIKPLFSIGDFSTSCIESILYNAVVFYSFNVSLMQVLNFLFELGFTHIKFLLVFGQLHGMVSIILFFSFEFITFFPQFMSVWPFMPHLPHTLGFQQFMALCPCLLQRWHGPSYSKGFSIFIECSVFFVVGILFA